MTAEETPIERAVRAQAEVPDGYTEEEWAQVWDDAFFGRGDFECQTCPHCGCPGME